MNVLPAGCFACGLFVEKHNGDFVVLCVTNCFLYGNIMLQFVANLMCFVLKC